MRGVSNREQNTFWIEPIAGLGNRMQVLASAYYFAEKYQKQMCVLWNNNGDVGADFDSIFELIPGCQVISVTTDGYHKKPILRYRSESLRKRLSETCDFVTDVDQWGGMTQEEIMKFIDTGLGQIGTAYIKSWKSFTPVYESEKIRIDFLKPSAVVSLRGEKVFSRIGAHTVGIHIRRTDHEQAIAESPLHAFIDEMQQKIAVDPACDFFVATDDPEVEKEIYAHFGKRVFFNEGKNWRRDARDGILDACVELWGLSKCKEILGSKGSTFSMMAAKIGNVRLSIAEC